MPPIPSQTLSRIVCNVQTDSVMNLSINSLKPKQSISVLLCEWYMGLPRWCTSNRSACQCRRYKRCRFNPWVREIPLEQEMSTQPVFLPEKSHGQRSLAGYSPCSHQELHTMEQLSTHSTHTCITYSIYGVIVKFMCQLDWVKGRPDSWEDIISGCVYEVFLEETSIWVGKLSKEDCAPQSRWASSNLLRALIEQKSRGRGTLLSYVSSQAKRWDETFIFCPWTSALPVLGPSDSNQDVILSAPLILRPSDSDTELYNQVSWVSSF